MFAQYPNEQQGDGNGNRIVLVLLSSVWLVRLKCERAQILVAVEWNDYIPPRNNPLLF